MIKALRFTYFLVITILLSGCDDSKTLFIALDDSKTNIDFSNDLVQGSDLNILNYLYYYNGAGVAAADYNGDGFIDLYFTSNERQDELYLNKGDFVFEKITETSGINNSDGWTTGVTNIDINNDGLMDLYICKVSGLRNLRGHNLLYINQGNNKYGKPYFLERAAEYGLDFSGFSTQSVFLDYDLDGDLDMYLLNHSIHPNRNYGRGNKRKGFDEKAGDRLFRNENGKFIDASKEAGIYQGIIGYGLGVAVGDLNNDGYPDLYVGNDFFENDYLYVNQQDGSFKDIISEHPERLGHTSHYSMGNDIADINNDGLADIISLDMLPENLKTYKTSGLEFPFQTYSNYLKNGFSPQFMQNTLHINQGNLNFSETAFLSGIASTEWSWSALFADFDNDAKNDLFISNGIKGATNDMDFIKFISNEKIQKQLGSLEEVNLEELTRELPEKKVNNYIYKNQGDQTFKDLSAEWLPEDAGFSHGSTYADLDNDGDLDLVVNNTNQKAGIYKNTSEIQSHTNTFLKVKLKGPKNNSLGIGTKVFVFTDGYLQMKEHYLSRGYLSSLPAGLHFGLNNFKIIDSIKVIWYDGRVSLKNDVKPSSVVEFDYKESKNNSSNLKNPRQPYFTIVDSLVDHYHTEQSTLDFNRQILSPFAYSNLSPKVSTGDLNGDGLDDILIGGGKTQPNTVFYQAPDGKFKKHTGTEFDKNAISENTDQVIVDIENDGDLDIITVSGGNEFKAGNAITPKIYLNTEKGFIQDKSNFEGISLNASTISAVDFDNDGDQDIFISANLVPGEIGKDPKNYFFENKGEGRFIDATTKYFSEEFGMILDVLWEDFNFDGYIDLITVGHWVSPVIYLNQSGKGFKRMDSNLDNQKGWWNDVEISDFDNDGDLDLVAGNWGLNTRLHASEKEPLKLYLNDFDDNGAVEPIISYFYKGKETVLSSKDELDQQLPFLKKKFNTYNAFAEAEFKEIFPAKKIANSVKKEVTELASCYFENMGEGIFKKHILPFEAQSSSIFAIEKFDFNKDGFDDLLLAGNNYEISTQLGRLDASHGTLLLNNGKNGFYVSKEIPNISGSARDIEQICIDNQEYLIITFNNGAPLLLKINV